MLHPIRPLVYLISLLTNLERHPQIRTHNSDDADIPPEKWLWTKIHEDEKDGSDTLHIPVRDDGKVYSIETLYDDQRAIVAEIINKIKEWMTCDDLSTFKPLRMTINGAGGSGKSVVINTLVAIIREMFQCNDVIKVVAPTGAAAFNVKGETLHHLCSNAVSKRQHIPNSMSADKRKALVKRFKTLLALIVDERSLLNSKDLGTVQTQIGETAYGGGHISDLSFGGVPVVVLAGDDFQLPGVEEGAFQALFRTDGAKMSKSGRSALKECAQFVMELNGSKRMHDSQIKQKKLLERLRIGDDLLEDDIQKLLSLHIQAMKRKHSNTELEKIKQKAVYLFYTNEKRIRHNMEQLLHNSSDVNPVAMMPHHSSGPVAGKAISSHFGNDPPDAALLCNGCRVAAESRNFQPLWGLHNGACGTIDEIIFEPGKSPNTGDLPTYIVVHFPLYCGPAWDINNPKVRA